MIIPNPIPEEKNKPFNRSADGSKILDFVATNFQVKLKLAMYIS